VDATSPLQRGVSSVTSRVRSSSIARRGSSSSRYEPPCKAADSGTAAAVAPSSLLHKRAEL
jgi:hypothetical protein